MTKVEDLWLIDIRWSKEVKMWNGIIVMIENRKNYKLSDADAREIVAAVSHSHYENWKKLNEAKPKSHAIWTIQQTIKKTNNAPLCLTK